MSEKFIDAGRAGVMLSCHFADQKTRQGHRERKKLSATEGWRLLSTRDVPGTTASMLLVFIHFILPTMLLVLLFPLL